MRKFSHFDEFYHLEFFGKSQVASSFSLFQNFSWQGIRREIFDRKKDLIFPANDLSDMRRTPGKTLQKRVARIRQDAVTCNFSSLKDPQDEALRSRSICSLKNDALLKALFKVTDDGLDLTRAI